jgi:DNA-binding GntR family transcriptional regulator
MKNSKSLREQIFGRILNDIMSGRLNAGEKLIEESLAKKYKVSRTPVREAIFQLEREGYVVHKKDVGAIVKKISFMDVQDIYEVISLLEAHAVQTVAESGLTRQELDHLAAMITDMEALAANRQYAEYMALNDKFHVFFVDKCSNRTVKSVVEDLRRRVYRIASMGITVPGNIVLYTQSHRKIYEAVASRDENLAYQVMRNHTRDQKRLLTEEVMKISNARLQLDRD